MLVGNLSYYCRSKIESLSQPAFDIISRNLSAEQRLNCNLLLEISDRQLSYIMYDTSEKKLFCVRHYHFEHPESTTAVRQLENVINADTYLQEEVKEIAIVYNFNESNLIPGKLFQIGMNKPLTDVVFGSVKKGLIISEKIKAFELYNVYRIPRDIHTLLQQRFAAGKYWHLYTLLLIANGVEGSDVCRVIFYADRIVVSLYSNGQLQLLQTWMYETPEDVAYYLLIICREYHIDQEKISVLVSGLIDEQSALYTELLKYFQYVVPEVIPSEQLAADLSDSFPLHYFSSLVKMASCV